MNMPFRTDPDLDDQTPAQRRVSAYRRCKSMLNPRWPTDDSATKSNVAKTPETDDAPWLGRGSTPVPGYLLQRRH